MGAYLHDLMANLGQTLQQGSVQSKLAALKSIAFTAEAAGPKFQPFALQLIPALHSYMQITEVKPGAATVEPDIPDCFVA